VLASSNVLLALASTVILVSGLREPQFFSFDTSLPTGVKQPKREAALPPPPFTTDTPSAPKSSEEAVTTESLACTRPHGVGAAAAGDMSIYGDYVTVTHTESPGRQCYLVESARVTNRPLLQAAPPHNAQRYPVAWLPTRQQRASESPPEGCSPPNGGVPTARRRVGAAVRLETRTRQAPCSNPGYPLQEKVWDSTSIKPRSLPFEPLLHSR
jgi:hypothetical protein